MSGYTKDRNILDESVNENGWGGFGVTGLAQKGLNAMGIAFKGTARESFAILLAYFKYSDTTTDNGRAYGALDTIGNALNSLTRKDKNKVSMGDSGEDPQSVGNAMFWGGVDALGAKGMAKKGAGRVTGKVAGNVAGKIGGKVAARGIGTAAKAIAGPVGWAMLVADLANDAIDIVRACRNRKNPTLAPKNAVSTLEKFFKTRGSKANTNEVQTALATLKSIVANDEAALKRNTASQNGNKPKLGGNRAPAAANNGTARTTNANGTLGVVNPANPSTWPNDTRSAFQFVQRYQNYPTQGAGWLRNVSSLTNNQKLVQHVRTIINNYYNQNNRRMVSESERKRTGRQTITLTESELTELVRDSVMEALYEARVPKMLSRGYEAALRKIMQTKGAKGVMDWLSKHKGMESFVKKVFPDLFRNTKQVNSNFAQQAAKNTAQQAGGGAIQQAGGGAIQQAGKSGYPYQVGPTTWSTTATQNVTRSTNTAAQSGKALPGSGPSAHGGGGGYNPGGGSYNHGGGGYNPGGGGYNPGGGGGWWSGGGKQAAKKFAKKAAKTGLGIWGASQLMRQCGRNIDPYAPQQRQTPQFNTTNGNPQGGAYQNGRQGYGNGNGQNGQQDTSGYNRYTNPGGTSGTYQPNGQPYGKEDWNIIGKYGLM